MTDETPSQGAAERADLLIAELRDRQRELEAELSCLRESFLAIEDSRSAYEAFYQDAPVGHCLLDRSGRILSINRTGATLLQSEPHTLAGESLSSMASTRQRVLLEIELERCFREGGSISLELNLRRAREGEVVVQLRGAAVCREDGSVSSCRAALTDISERKRREEGSRFLAKAGKTLAYSLDYRRVVGRAAELGVARLADCCLVDLVAEDLPQELHVAVHADPKKGDRVRELVALYPPEPGLKHGVTHVLRTGVSEIYPRPGRGRRNAPLGTAHPRILRELECRSYLCVPLSARGHLLGAMTLISSESDRRFDSKDLEVAEGLAERTALAIENARLYQRAQDEVRLRQDILAVVSHDLKTPLNNALLGVEVLLNHAPREERRTAGRKQLELIRRAVLRMDRMITDLLDLSSIEAGHLSIEREEQALQTLGADAVEAIQASLEHKRVEVETHFPSEIVSLHCDRDRILQVLANLLGNAVKFTPEGGRVVVRGEQQGQNVLISISDTGPGIPKSRLAHVFDRYWQAAETARSGRGLGLFIAKGIVAAHGGRIWVESRVGAGSTFFFTIPLRPASADPLTGVALSEPTDSLRAS